MTTTHNPVSAPLSAHAPVAQALNSVEQTVSHATTAAADHVNQSLHTLVHEVSPALSRMAEQVANLSRQGVQAVQSGGHQLSDKVHHASDSTVGYIRSEPVKSVLMAAVLGATLVTVFNLLSRPHHPHH